MAPAKGAETTFALISPITEPNVRNTAVVLTEYDIASYKGSKYTE